MKLKSEIGLLLPTLKTLCGAKEVDGEGFSLSKLISIVAGLCLSFRSPNT